MHLVILSNVHLIQGKLGSDYWSTMINNKLFYHIGIGICTLNYACFRLIFL